MALALIRPTKSTPILHWHWPVLPDGADAYPAYETTPILHWHWPVLPDGAGAYPAYKTQELALAIRD